MSITRSVLTVADAVVEAVAVVVAVRTWTTRTDSGNAATGAGMVDGELDELGELEVPRATVTVGFGEPSTRGTTTVAAERLMVA